MNRFRDDLGAAGISYVDEKGEYADFHALRKTYGTFLMLLGLPEFVRMKLMRHSDVRLTQKDLYRRKHSTDLGFDRRGIDWERHTNRHTKISRKGSKRVRSCPVERSGADFVSRWRTER